MSPPTPLNASYNFSTRPVATSTTTIINSIAARAWSCGPSESPRLNLDAFDRVDVEWRTRTCGGNVPSTRFGDDAVEQTHHEIDDNSDGTRTRNPQIRSLIRYPLRHGVEDMKDAVAVPWER